MELVILLALLFIVVLAVVDRAPGITVRLVSRCCYAGTTQANVDMEPQAAGEAVEAGPRAEANHHVVASDDKDDVSGGSST